MCTNRVFKAMFIYHMYIVGLWECFLWLLELEATKSIELLFCSCFCCLHDSCSCCWVLFFFSTLSTLFLRLLTHKRHIICFMCMSLSQSPTKCTFHSCMCLHIVIALCTFVLRFCVCNSRAGTFLKHYLLSWQP